MSKAAPFLGNRQEFVSVQVRTSVEQTQFSEQPNLQRYNSDIQIKCIETYSADVLPTDPNEFDVVSAAAVKGSFLVLKIQNQEMWNSYPLVSLAPEFNNGLIREVDLLNVDWNQSYVETPDPTLFSADQVFVFNVSYNLGYKGEFGLY